jgi:lipopolysaccharide export system permease protein
MLLRISDRYIIRSFMVSFVICAVALVSTFVVIDTFSNLTILVGYTSGLGANASSHAPGVFAAIARGLREFFLVVTTVLKMNVTRMPLIFYELMPVLIVSAAMFTVTRLSRANEITPLLASGVSIYRIMWPIFLMMIVLTIAQVADKEFLIPRFSRSILDWERVRTRDSAGYKRRLMVEDSHGNIVFASRYRFDEKIQYGAEITRYWSQGSSRRPMVVIHAQTAAWQTVPFAGWLYENGTIIKYDPDGNVMPQKRFAEGIPESFVPLVEGDAPLPEYRVATNMTPARLETEELDIRYRPTLYLLQYARDHGLRGDIALDLNKRIASPLSNAVLLLLGLPFVLKRNLKSPFLAILIAIGITGAYFALSLITEDFAMEGRYLTPLTGAWAPIIIFGPIGVLLFDTVES